MATDPDYERVLLVKPTVYLYRIPPLMSASRGFRAADWLLAQPDWVGRLRLVTKGDSCFVRFEEVPSGFLYCQAILFTYPGPQLQPVVDSRRYFVVKVVSDTGRTALLGLGFGDAADAFDLKVALHDHFKIENVSSTSEPEVQGPRLDLSLKGDIRVNLKIGEPKNSSDSGATRPKLQSKDEVKHSDPSKPFVLPPPPASTRRTRDNAHTHFGIE